jgi:hypothetical protein
VTEEHIASILKSQSKPSNKPAEADAELSRLLLVSGLI